MKTLVTEKHVRGFPTSITRHPSSRQMVKILHTSQPLAQVGASGDSQKIRPLPLTLTDIQIFTDSSASPSRCDAVQCQCIPKSDLLCKFLLKHHYRQLSKTVTFNSTSLVSNQWLASEKIRKKEMDDI